MSLTMLAAAAAAAGTGESFPAAVASWTPSSARPRASDQQGERRPACKAGSDLGSEAVGDLGRVAELADRRLCGLGVGQASRAVRVGCVQEPRTQLGDDARAGTRRARQPGCDLGQVALERWPSTRLGSTRLGRAEPVHCGLTASGAGWSRAVTAAENSRQVLRSVSRARRPAEVSW